MSSNIINKQSNTSGKIPLLSDLELGEFAVNTYDGKIFLKKFQEYFDDNLQQQVTEETIAEFASSVPVENTFYVQKNGNDRNDGSSWDSAFKTIEKALEVIEQRNKLTLIKIGPGEYTTEGHIDVPDDTVIQAVHRTVFFKPETGYEERNVFRLGSGCFLEGIVFEGFRLDDLDNPTEGFAVAFRPGANIKRVPYVHKVAVRTPPYWTSIAPPLDRENANPLIGRGGGVILADGAVLDPDSIFPNIMAWGATPVTHNGIGYCAKNGGLINAINAISIWAHKHFYAIDGGQIVLSACSTQFGDYTLVSKGTRKIIDPCSILDFQNLSIETASAQIIEDNTETIITDLLDSVELQTFTTNWLDGYEELTERDARLFLQALIWVLQTADEKPMLDFAKGFFTVNADRAFEPADYDIDKCYRDLTLISDAVSYDILFDTNYRSINAALAYYRANASEVINNQLSTTIQALTEQKNLFSLYLSGTSLTRSNALFDEIIDILTNGQSSADPYSLTDPTNYENGYFNARRLLVANKIFIQDEIDAWIAVQIAGNISPFNNSFTYDVAKCRRDVGLIIDALRYDLTYGGNLETYNAAISYFVGNSSQLGTNEKQATIATYNRLKTVLNDVLQGVLITPSTGNSSVQDNSGVSGSTSAALFAQARIDDIIFTINSDGIAPVKILPDITWPDIEFQNSHTAIQNDKNRIARDVIKEINLENKTLLGSFIYSWQHMRNYIINLSGISASAIAIVDNLVDCLLTTIISPEKLSEPSVITAIGHTWTGIMAGVALTKIPPVRNSALIPESILELDRGIVIASGQDDQGSALFIGGMEINADTGELTGPPFDSAVNRIATRAAISRSF